jgi:hypothetical protein
MIGQAPPCTGRPILTGSIPPPSAGGTGKTTVEVYAAHTFLDAGWDFEGETRNGTADLWWIREGSDYPRLLWERAPSQP